VNLIEFEGRVYGALIELQKVCDAAPSVRDQKLPSDLRELLSFVRTAAAELILCSSVPEAIDRLKRDPKELGAVEYVASLGLSDDEIKGAIRRAFENKTEDTPALPCMAFCSYLIELCNGLEPGKGPHKT
jgi:hypothetical protein